MILILIFLLVLRGSLSAICNWDVDSMILQDVSESYLESMGGTQKMISYLVDQFSSTFTRTRFAISSFVDKPIPFRGIGGGRGHPEELDYCYRRESGLLSNPDKIKAAHSRLDEGMGSGGDGPENIYEALIYAAIDLDIYSKFTINLGRPRVKFVIAATDDLPHYQNDSKIGIDWWNGNTHSDDRGTTTPLPHFLDEEFLSYDFGINMPTIYSPDGQGPMADYHDLVTRKDQEDSEEYERLMNLLGPLKYPAPKAWTGLSDPDFTQTGSSKNSKCATSEYPSLDDVKSTLKDRNTFPVILISEPIFVTAESAALCALNGFPFDPNASDAKSEFLQCMMHVYNTDLAKISDQFVVMPINKGDPKNLAVELIHLLKDIGTDLQCREPPGPGAWIAGAGVGAAILACTLPCALRKPVVAVQIDQQIPELNPNLSETSYEFDAADTCSWDNYI